MITSLHNEKVKLTRALQTRARARRKERKIVLEGTRLVRDAVEQGHRPHFVFYQPGSSLDELLNLLQQTGTELSAISPEIVRYITTTEHPQGVVGVFPLPDPPLPADPDGVLIADQVGDPGNLGTMIRTAAAAGVHCVLLSPGCVDPYNPKTLRSGMGAHFRVPVIEAGWDKIAAFTASLTVYLAAADGSVPYDSVNWRDPWGVIIGSEARGVSPESEKLAHQRIYIPMAAQTESLNAALAAGVILFEAARQRR